MDSPTYRRFDRFCLVLGWAALAVGIWSSITFARATLPHVGGLDFFFYLCHSRDQVRGFGDRHIERFVYFPGVYAFWRTAMSLGATSLIQLQAVHLAVLGCGGALVALIVYRAARSVVDCGTALRWLAAGYAGVWYWVICSRFEGTLGTTEPLATVVFMTGLLAWCGHPLRGGAGWLRSAALGAAFGVALYVKQQAGLLSLGALGLLPGCWATTRPDGHRLQQAAALPIIAVSSFALAAVVDGVSLAALLTGVKSVAFYPVRSTWLDNLYSLARNDASTALVVLIAVPAALATLALAERRGTANPAIRVAGFAACAVVATMVQFRWRGYHHYFLLAAPMLVIAAVILGIMLLCRYRANLSNWRWRRVFLFGIALFPLAYTSGVPANLHVWRIKPQQIVFAQSSVWYSQPRIAHSLRHLSDQFNYTDLMLVFPPQRNEVFWFVGSQSPGGYGWGNWESRLPDPRLDDPDLRHVVVLDIDPTLGLPDWTGERWVAVIAELTTHGFKLSERMPGMSVWQR